MSVPPSEGLDVASVNWKRIARDTTLVFALGVAGGFVLGVAGFRPHDPQSLPASHAMSFGMQVLGFAIVSVCTPVGRWRHLALVAGGLWLVNLIGVPLERSSIQDWALGIVGISLAMGIGGGLSCFFPQRRLDPPAVR